MCEAVLQSFQKDLCAATSHHAKIPKPPNTWNAILDSGNAPQCNLIRLALQVWSPNDLLPVNSLLRLKDKFDKIAVELHGRGARIQLTNLSGAFN